MVLSELCVFKCALETGAQFKNEGRKELWKALGAILKQKMAFQTWVTPPQKTCLGEYYTIKKKSGPIDPCVTL